MEETEGPGKAQTKKLRGFAALPEVQRKALAAKGGRMVHAMCRGRQFTSAEGAVQGRKGGLALQASGKAHRFTSEEARAAQAKGAASKKRKAA